MRRLKTSSGLLLRSLIFAALLVSSCRLAQAQASQPAKPPGVDTTTQQPAPAPHQTDAAPPTPAAPTTTPASPEELRQAQLVADTNKLYQMAQELQAEVAKSNKDTLSLAVIKKATEVETLARSLKERMRTEH
jgi:hypothetical protein